MERFAVLLVPVVLIGGIAQLYLGFVGIQFHLGSLWAFGALFLAFGLRFMLPITIGSYFGVVDVLGWSWWAGILIALPGILFVVPGIIATTVEALFSRK